MPIGPNSRISILTFPQSWDGQSLVVRFLCLPAIGPLDPLRPGLTSFADSNLIFEAKLIGSLDHLPLPGDTTPVGPLSLDDPPVQKAELFRELAEEFNIQPRVIVPRAPVRFQKAMTPSYRALIGNRRHSDLLVDPDLYTCALHQGSTDQPPVPVVLSDAISWGKVMAHALRQPKLAGALGLLGQVTVPVPDPSFFGSGGWLYLDLHATSDYGGDADIANRYAARIPKLSDARSLFSAILFPVSDSLVDFTFDDVAYESQLYDDGFAKQVHCIQGGGHGDSIQLAWDDEQIALWLHRQVQLTPTGDMVTDAPNGVSGYRVDVRLKDTAEWNSLMQMRSLGDLQLGPLSLGSFQGEGIVEVAPAQVSPKQEGLFWLPSYFANWRGSSLVLTDADLTKLHARPEVQNPDAPPHFLDREKVFEPVNDKAVRLTYGETYEFRVRLADLTRGGPESGAPSPNPPRSSITSLLFQRQKAPGLIEILERPAPESRKIRFAKPRLGHPEALFTSESVKFKDLEDDLAVLAANPNITREISIPDPDVLTVEIEAQVKALDGDVARYLTLYTTMRTFDKDELTIDLDFQDHATLLTLAKIQPPDGALALPAARDLRLILVGVGRDEPGYFVSDLSRRGAPVMVDFRAAATAEAALLGEPETFPSLRSFFFQPPPPDNTVSPPGERLAAEIGLDHTALTLSGRPGHRTVMACSAELRHTLSPESSSITFFSGADLVQRWINVLHFQVLRDWTWNGLETTGITITRVVHFPVGDDLTETVGVIQLPRVIGKNQIPGDDTVSRDSDSRNPIRQFTNLIFFDALDPKPTSLHPLPSEITVEYHLQPMFQGLPPTDPISRSILLPITTPPSQTPEVISAGIALSGFVAADDYSSTSLRHRALWFEFAAPPDEGDALYVRVLAKAPDPMLLDKDLVLPDTTETATPIDPEWVRVITPGQPRDESGLQAMQQLVPSSDTPQIYLVPLPPDLQESSPELFGFFVYEVRYGHDASRWSTAQGRFGSVLRMSGVQHPAPPLICQAARNTSGVFVRAPFANSVLNGVNFRSFMQRTDLWALLYARVRQADAAAFRNVLLARIQLRIPHEGNNPEVLGFPTLFGEGFFQTDAVSNALLRLGLPRDEALTVLAAEMFADPPEQDPLGNRLGEARILRISPLIPVPDAC
jgi:hypothetical protein